MFIIHMLSRFKSLLLSLITLFRRALCCFSRRRRHSFSECEILTSVNVVQSSNTSRHRNEDERDWNSWDDSPRTVGEHIEQYRQKLGNPKVSDENQEPVVDFFQDMEPKVSKQKKLFVDKNKAATENFSRLQATSAAAIPRLQTAELEDWSDGDNEDAETGWDEVSDEATKAMIREKRREVRAQRQHRLQQQKEQQQRIQTKGGLYAHP